ncbi:MAG: reverse transcriptase family protein [bacterium]|nr:reverse transcriptase family protein [bacterium]
MTNPLLFLWNRLRGQQPNDWYTRYYRSRAALDAASQRVVGTLYRGFQFDYEHAADLLHRDSLHPRYRYRRFTQPKADGSERVLHEPDRELKAIQRDVLKYLLEPLPPHPAAVGYRRHKSIADHAWAHAGASVVILADVADFFPSTFAERVERWWREALRDKYAYPNEELDTDTAAHLMTLLTTYRGSLPQGAPTSPALSNLVNREMDERLERRAAQCNARYTRYCDDLAFSWRGHDRPPADFEAAVRGVLGEYGYTLHTEKGWRVYQGQDEPTITGVILKRGGTVDLPDEIKTTMRQLARSRDEYDAARLEGYRAYEAMVKRKGKKR